MALFSVLLRVQSVNKVKPIEALKEILEMLDLFLGERWVRSSLEFGKTVTIYVLIFLPVLYFWLSLKLSNGFNPNAQLLLNFWCYRSSFLKKVCRSSDWLRPKIFRCSKKKKTSWKPPISVTRPLYISFLAPNYFSAIHLMDLFYLQIITQGCCWPCPTFRQPKVFRNPKIC